MVCSATRKYGESVLPFFTGITFVCPRHGSFLPFFNIITVVYGIFTIVCGNFTARCGIVTVIYEILSLFVEFYCCLCSHAHHQNTLLLSRNGRRTKTCAFQCKSVLTRVGFVLHNYVNRLSHGGNNISLLWGFHHWMILLLDSCSTILFSFCQNWSRQV